MSTSAATLERTAVISRHRGRAGIAHRVLVPLLALVVGAVHATIGLIAWRSYRIGSWDLTLFDETVRAYSRFRPLVQEALGIHIGAGPHLLALGDHFSPALALLAPAYWVWPDPRMLILVEALLIAVATVLAWVYARRELGVPAAYALATAFGLAWPLQEASFVGFHETLLAVPLLMVAFVRLQAGHRRQAALAALALITVKEDLCLVAAAFGVLLWLRGSRRLGCGLAVAGVVAAYVETTVVIPALSTIGVPKAVYYKPFLDALPDPVAAVRVLVEPLQKWKTLGLLLVPWSFLSVASPLSLVGLPQLGIRAASANSLFWGTAQHYNAVQVPILYAAAVAVATRLRARRVRQAWVVWTVVAAACLCTQHPARLLWTPSSWRTDAREAAGEWATSLVPPGVRVEADNEIGPHLARRDDVLLLDTTPRGAPWVVVDVGKRSVPFTSLAAQRARVRVLESKGYRLISDDGQYAVLTTQPPR